MGSSSPVSFYHLRVEFTTRSDWATLDFRRAADRLIMRQVAVTGAPSHAALEGARLAISQPLERATAGTEAGLTVDLALKAGAAGRPLALRLNMGHINDSTVRLCHVDGDRVRALGEYTTKGIPPGNGWNLSLPLTGLNGVAARQANLAVPGGGRKLLAFYYTWYTEQYWSAYKLKDEPFTPYRSEERAALARHIDQAQGAGISGWVSSWWGPGHETDMHLATVLELAREKGFDVSIYLETLDRGKGRSASQLVDWLVYFLSEYGEHPSLLRVAGKPVIFLWASDAIPLETWRQIFAQVRAAGHDACFLGMTYSTATLDVFDGLHSYTVDRIQGLAALNQALVQTTRYYSLLTASAAPKLFAATVQPGYDDTLIPERNGGRTVEREGGDFYRRTWEAAIAGGADWVVITTWNEWPEHTYIEPSRLYGDLYLRLTGEFARRWRSV